MEKLPINQIAEISTGFPFRSSINNVLGDEVKVIQAKDIKTGILVDLDNLISVEDQNFQQRFYVKKDDVLLSARGIFHASVVCGEVENVIASFSVYILRVASKKVKPEYLAIFFNSMYGQKVLSERSIGAAIRTILRRHLEDMIITVPSLEKQQQIIDIYKNNQKQQIFLKQKAFLTDKISQGAINKILNNK
ncbi:MAG: restriction endonuclease subunit S [Patescibacteria group bacterium]|nr:restriction endonuclease subunit S [Patescibacteria group bacterium]